LLEVHGFDLLAGVEEMLRHVRDYQREVQRLRGLLDRGQAITSDLPALRGVQEQLNRLKRTWSEVGATLREIEQLLA
jgi:hypothetical protein